MLRIIKRGLFAFLVATLGLSSSLHAVVGQGITHGVAQYAPGEVLVSYKKGIDTNNNNIFNILNTILGQNQFTQVFFEKLSISFIKSDKYTTQELLEKFRALDSVKSVSPNYVNYIMGATNDTHYNELWAMENTGANGGLNDADIDASEAWDVQSGSRDVVVAVVDTGIDYTHNDLVDNMWDGSAYGIPHHGYDFSGSNDDDPMAGHSHGTHVAGTIGASANNNLGVVGVANQVSLMALKVFSDSGDSAYDSDILEAMEFISDMIDKGVNIVAINASYGGGGNSDTMKDAIEELGTKGVIMCAAAGNDDNNNDNNPSYPASYDLDNIISVAATDNRDELASFSNYGVESVDIAAPGVGILSTINGDDYDSWSGTSMATPHVAGAVALLAAQDANTTVAQRVNLLLSSVDIISSLSNKVASGGRLNVYTALTGEPGEEPVEGNVTSWTTGAYGNNEDRREALRITDATNLVVTITGETEARYDFIYIYDENGNQIAKLDGTIDETLTVEGSSVTARLTSDGSVTKSGVTVNIAKPEGDDEDPVEGNVTSWTTGAYGNNEDRSEVLSISNATALIVTIKGETEARYDYIYIYDEDGNQIAKLDGKMNETITVAGSSITARLTSDGSVTKSGVTVSITAKDDGEDPGEDEETSWTTGAYENNEDRSQVLSIAGATSLFVTVEGETEARYDFIYLYDENGNQIAKLDGSIDTSRSVSGSSITARLTSDGSITKSGATVTISAE